MKCATARTTLAVAVAALLAAPAASGAQQPTPSPRSSSPVSRPAASDAQQGSAQDHLRQAKSALNEIPAESLTGTAKTRVAELKRHISNLEQSAAGTPASETGAANRSARATATPGKANWSTEVAAADRILSELLGASATGATEPAATGTTGAVKGAKTGAATVTLDDTARAKLGEVRTHLTAFAAGMSGTSSSPAPSPSSDDPAAPASASAPAPPSAAASPAASAEAQPQSPTPAAAAAAPPAAAQSQQPPAGEPTPSPATPQSSTSTQADTEAVRKHLTAARDTLSQLTQLPAAAQLTGDARTQVSQLITNFNELITTNTEWRASYTKVQANLNALVGDQRADESPTPAPGAAGAVGTAGTVALDPAIRAKLVEFRTHLTQFEKAAGGASASPTAEPAAAPAAEAPAAEARAAEAPAAQQPSEPPAAAPAQPSPAEPAQPAANPSPTSTAGSSSTPTATAGTSGVTSARGEDPQTAKPAAGASQQASQQHAEAMRHIEAIEAILNGTSAAGTSGSTTKGGAKPAAPTTLDRAQIEQIRSHLAELRRSLSQAPQK